jgi:hypothetical protein
MVEPRPAFARKLRALYQDDGRITVLQAALDRRPGGAPKPMIYVDLAGPAAPTLLKSNVHED